MTVISGGASGLTATTDTMGAYTLQVPAGSFQLRWSRPGYVSVDGSVQTSLADGHTTMPDVTLATAPWGIAGTVSDRGGNPVQGAMVRFDVGGLFTVSAPVTTGPDGRYRFSSSTPHFDTVTVGASEISGFVPLEGAVSCCNPPADAILDLRLVRIVSLTPHAPTTLRVGEHVEIAPVDVVYDDGASRSIFVMPTSSTPAEVAVERGLQGYVISGVKVGAASLTFDLYGLHPYLQVHVVE